MLFAKPTKYKAGLTLYGDFNDFGSLHSTVHALTDKSPLDGRLGEFMLNFAYDLRHTYQGDREISEFGDEGTDRVTYFGCSFLWPYFLTYVGLLRWAAAFNPTTKDIQANLFRLEHCTGTALLESDAKVGKQVIDLLSGFQGYSDDYLLQFFDDACLDYVAGSRAGRERFRTLPSIMRRLHPASKDYREFKTHLEQTARFQKCNPHDLVSKTEWPDFKW